MEKYKTMDANEAVSLVSYNFSEICGIYPITPASPMAELTDVYSNKGKLNYFNNKVNVIEMQSESGAIALVHGALQSGSLATTFTASQGLLLMIPTLYKLAGEMLPAVIHVAARSLSTHALSIFGDHQDVYATRSTGVCILSSSSVTEAYHMANIAHLSAIKASLPFIHFFDGFRTSHEINKVKLIDENKIKELVDKKALSSFRETRMNPLRPNTRGTAQNDDVYFQNTEARNLDYQNCYDVVLGYMDKFNKINHTDYKPFNYYGSPKADIVLVAMGSICETAKEVISALNKGGKNYGLIQVHLYRPFNSDALRSVLPDTVKKVVVLDRTKEAGSNGEPLYLDVCAGLFDKNLEIYGGRYGLSSKNTTPADVKAVFDYASNNTLFNDFTIGIVDDVTNKSLQKDDNFRLENDYQELLIYGYGSDGMVSTSKDLLKIIGDHTNNFVQGYFQYDSKKSGGVTRSHIRISNNIINAPYYVDKPKFVVVSNDTYMYKYNIVENICDNGVLLLNTRMSEEDINKTLNSDVKRLIKDKNITFYVIDAYSIVSNIGLKNKISTCMEVCIFKILDVLNMSKVIKLMKDNNSKRFAHKGKKIVDINNQVVDNTLKYLKKIDINKFTVDNGKDNLSLVNNADYINKLMGDLLPVSRFIANKDGIVEGGNSKFEKREIASKVPCYVKENCIQCNQCAFVCPHAVIRPFLTDKKLDDSIPAILPNEKDLFFNIGVSYKDCTSCGVCASVCPGKKGNKALVMKEYDGEIFKQEEYEYLINNNVNDRCKSEIMNVKNIGFMEPKFEFSGACAGCGETAYIKNLTQMFGRNLMIANATGCSSIYGSSSPSTPYSIPWASSLFEDNTEYGLGIYLGYQNNRMKIKKYMEENRKKDKLFELWLNNYDNYNICSDVYNKINYKKHPYLELYKNYILPITMFIIGGDGFAYDIGFGGLDHIISTNYDVNILVLDTEVYSNTGGQTSKSSNIGSVASFADAGKKNFKKDLARIGLCYPNCYVACVNIAYDKEHYLKVLKEAKEHKGPSLIIAYSPCIEHGNKAGMEHSLDNGYLATKCGYFLTFKYNPADEKFILNSKNVDFDLYEEFLSKENRYTNTEDKNLLVEQKIWAMKRYEYYKSLEDNTNN